MDKPVAGRCFEVLIVEDSRTQAMKLSHLLSRNGYATAIAANGRIALEAIKLRRPGMVISDVIMPEMNGYELCEAIKADPELHELPVILLTSLGDPQDVIRGLQCGADNFIIKSSDDDFLLRRIEDTRESSPGRETELGAGVEVTFAGQKHVITSDRAPILNLLLSTYAATAAQNAELKRAKEEAERANRAKSDFVARVNHELRNPMTAVFGFAQMLELGVLTSEQQQSVQHILKAGEHLLHLVDEMLDIARIDADRMEICLKPVSLFNLLEEAISLTGPQALQRGIQIFHPVIGRDVFVRADEHRLRQVILNLLSNAVKYNRPSGTVIVRTDGSADGMVRIDVCDTGAGIGSADLDRLFEPFQRLHADHDGVKGTGLGLVISKKLIEAMGGSIGVDSVEGSGSSFWIQLRSCPTTADAAPVEFESDEISHLANA